MYVCMLIPSSLPQGGGNSAGGMPYLYVLQCVATSCGVSVCCNVMQCVAACCSSEDPADAVSLCAAG